MTDKQLLFLRIAVVGAITAIVSFWLESQFKSLIGK